MARRQPIRPCTHRNPDRTGCPESAAQVGSRCEQHEREHARMQQREGAKLSATAEWQRLRRRVLDRDGHRCTCCGKTEAQLKVEGNALEVHHRDGDHENNALPNLTALCRTPCHRQIVQPAVRRTRLARAVHPQGDRGA